MILQFLLAMVATSSFAVLYGVPKNQFVYSSLTGALGWISYLFFCKLGAGIVFASLFASFFLTIVSRTGIFTLVPGAGIYYTSYYFIMNNMNQFAAKGMETFKIAGAISIGIIFGFSIPQRLFQLKKH